MKASIRYAKSLLELAVERNELEAISEDMKLMENTIGGSRDLVLFLRSPIISKSQKLNVLQEVFADKISTTTKAFIDILVRKGRESDIVSVGTAFRKLYNVHSGIVEVEITTAAQLGSEQRIQLAKSLEARTGKKVILSERVDPSVRGGIRARIDDTVIDGTIQNKLEQLRNTLLTKG
jgi:F-type H+-transporting ATPase subunit delta